jgi:hypothetical protein
LKTAHVLRCFCLIRYFNLLFSLLLRRLRLSHLFCLYNADSLIE